MNEQNNKKPAHAPRLQTVLARLLILIFIAAPAALLATAPARAQSAAEVAALERGLALMRKGQWDEARTAAGPPGSIGSDIVEWNRLRSSKGSFAETLAFLARRPDWPGLDLLRERSEQTIPDDASAAAVLDFFLAQPPQAGAGTLRFAKALWDTGAKQEAMAEAIRGWTTFSLSPEEETGFMTDWPKTLAAHHWDRMDMLLWRGLSDQARRQLARVDETHQALANARIGLRESANGVDELISRVPASLTDDPGLAYERFQWRVRKGRNDSAIELILERSGSAAALGDPERWAQARLDLARWAMRADKPKTAYALAARHYLGAGDDRNELEWLAGYVALRKLGDAETALRHFHAFAEGVETPISLSRAGYWEGRALEALGRKDEAQAAYAAAGKHQTAFYGLLAAEKAGLSYDPALAGTQTYPGYDQAAFWTSSGMQAARLSLAAGERYLARRFAAHLSESLDATALGQLMQWAEDQDAPYLQLSLAKYAIVYHGRVYNRPYFPNPDIGAGNPGVPRPLELSIARRESEFNPGVTSGVGAMGLMQLMPGTAKDMAKRLNIAYEPGKLHDGFAYNTRLGSEYLAYLIEKFGQNPVLIAVGYNAGPGRVTQWIERYGDPRSANVDVVDWIESIPFDETQTYVMRVTESLPNYRARRTGETGPVRFTDELKQR